MSLTTFGPKDVAKIILCFSPLPLLYTIATTVFDNHFQTSHVSCE